uniref:Peptidase metallopeptidase domain-containing protein n=1 Tax=Panagrolaimus sp. PS1159 TaxID=55785 RepID=A0AC35GP40_9BILA
MKVIVFIFVFGIIFSATNAYRWKKNPVTFSVQNYTSTLSSNQIRDGVTQAFNIWSKVIPLDFKECCGNSADILLSFKPLDGTLVGWTNYKWNGDGAFYHADTYFNNRNSWGLKDPRKTDIIAVAVHEIGHALGLTGHSGDSNSVMNSWIKWTDGNGNYRYPQLSSSDISNIQNLYGRR